MAKSKIISLQTVSVAKQNHVFMEKELIEMYRQLPQEWQWECFGYLRGILLGLKLKGGKGDGENH